MGVILEKKILHAPQPGANTNRAGLSPTPVGMHVIARNYTARPLACITMCRYDR